jgi:hypothetical protein
VILPLGTVVDWTALFQTVIAAVTAGVGTSVACATAILGAIRFSDMRRDERSLEAGAFAVLTVVASLAIGAAIVIGLIVMTSK